MKPLDSSTGFLVVAALLAAGSLGWCAWSAQHLPMRPIAPLAAAGDGVTAAGTGAVVADEALHPWQPPPAQSHGAAWVYDVFTPPEIFYDAAGNRFTVTPPALRRPSAGLDGLAGLELAGVAREPYRVQLVGFIGGEGDWRGTFEDAQTGATLLGQAGHVLEDTGMTVRSLEVRRMRVDLPESMSTTQRVATAVLRDERTGEEIELNSAERRYTDIGVATVITPDGSRHELHAGDDLAVGDDVFHVTAIRFDPPAVDLTHASASEGGAPERHTLSLKPAAAAPAISTSTAVAP